MVPRGGLTQFREIRDLQKSGTLNRPTVFLRFSDWCPTDPLSQSPNLREIIASVFDSAVRRPHGLFTGLDAHGDGGLFL